MAILSSINIESSSAVDLPKEYDKKATCLYWIDEIYKYQTIGVKKLIEKELLPKLQLYLVSNSFIVSEDQPGDFDVFLVKALNKALKIHNISLDNYPFVNRWISSTMEFFTNENQLSVTSFQSFKKNILEKSFKLVARKSDSMKKKEEYVNDLNVKKTEILKNPIEKLKNVQKNIPEISKLDIRVGEITAIKTHPERGKLYVEEIFFGDGGKRTIISGIVENYPDSSILLNKKVCVVCNLKPRKMGSVVSQGMVLCASNMDKSNCVVVEAPEGTKLNEKVEFTNLDISNLPPWAPNKMAKQKVMEKLIASKKLKTDKDGYAFWAGEKEYVFKTSTGKCKTSISKGLIS